MPTNLTLRSVVSPYGDITTNSVLSFADVDNNFIYLKGKTLNTGSLNGANLVLTNLDTSTVSVDLSSLSGSSSNIYNSNGTLLGNRTITQSTYSLTFNATTPTRFNSSGSVTIGGLEDSGYWKLQVSGANRVTGVAGSTGPSFYIGDGTSKYTAAGNNVNFPFIINNGYNNFELGFDSTGYNNIYRATNSHIISAITGGYLLIRPETSTVVIDATGGIVKGMASSLGLFSYFAGDYGGIGFKTIGSTTDYSAITQVYQTNQNRGIRFNVMSGLTQEEAMRLSVAKNLLIGATSDGGNKLYLSGTTDPLRIVGLTANSADADVLTIDTNGVIHTVSKSSLGGGGSSPIGLSGTSLYSITPATSNFSGSRSIFFGFENGLGATNATESVFLGYSAGKSATNASQSNIIGTIAGYQATNASYSVFHGYGAGYQATNASYSVFVGSQAGFGAPSASNSVLIGYGAGRNGISSNNIIIGAGKSLPNGTSNSINIGGVLFGNGVDVYAGGDASQVPSADGKIGIGLVTPTNSLTVSGVTDPLRILGLTANSGDADVLTIDTNGVIHTVSKSSIGGGGGGGTDVYVTGGTFNVNNNTATFTNSTGGTFNVGNIGGPIGLSGTSLYTIVPGTENVPTQGGIYFGEMSGRDATNSNDSVFIGYVTGMYAAGCEQSVFIGYGAGNGAGTSYGSVFMGVNAGFAVGNDYYSNFIGYGAGFQAANSSGSNMIGYNAGYQTNSQQSNFIGYQAGKTFGSNVIGNNNTIIGTNISLPNGSTNSFNIGGILFGNGMYSNIGSDPSIGAQSNGKIGIGIVSPTNSLTVSGITDPLRFIGVTANTNDTDLLSMDINGVVHKYSRVNFSASTVKVDTISAVTTTIILPNVVNLNYADDSFAAAGGVPIGGIYHNNGALRIRLT